MSDLDSMIESALGEPVVEKEIETPEVEIEATEEPIGEPLTTEEIQELAAPEGWSGFAKTKWGVLPKDVQQELLNYHKSVADYQKSIDDKGKVYNALETTLGDRKQAAVATYGSLEGMFDHYFKLDQWAAQDPVGLIKWFIQQRGIDPSTFGQSGEPAQAQPQDPVLQKLQELEAKLNGQNQSAQNVNITSAQRQIEEFSKNPSYPYFPDLRDDMAILMQTGKAKDLPDAYQKAMRLNDKTSPIWMEQELKKQNDLKAQDAKKSKQAATIKGANGAVHKKPGQPIDDIIHMAMGTDRI